MPKLLIFSDLHLHNHKRSNERLDDCLQTLNWIFETAEKREVPYIICVGDLFHTRQKVDVLTYQRAFELFEQHNKSKIHLLIGNHDMWYEHNWDVSSIIPLGVLPHVNVVIAPTTVDIDGFPVSFLPYTKDPIESLKKIKSRELLFAHVAVNGAILNTRANTFSEEFIEHDGEMVKIDNKVFDGWKRVFLGHYHHHQEITKQMWYVGSPLQLSYGEAFDKKYIIIYDTDTDTPELVENNFSPKHFVINPEQINHYQFGKRAFIRIQVSDINSPENLEIQNSVLNLCENASEIKIEPTKKKIVENKQLVEDAQAILRDDEEMAQKYIDQVGNTNLDRAQLLSIFNLIRMKREINV